MILATLHDWVGFGAYFFVVLLFYVLIWKVTGWHLDRRDAQKARKFREKVDRYRR